MGNVVTERGFKYGLTETDTWTVSQSGNFNAGDYGVAIKNLTAGTAYHVRAYAVNSAGTSYGEYVQFITEAEFTTTPIIFKSGVILKEKTILK
jgi:large repetitive protein